jgi:cytochrome c biogenesis protein CcdA
MALLGVYSVGAGMPMLAIAYGGNRVSKRLETFTRQANLLRKAFGGIAIAVALLQLVHYDVAFIAWATQWLPSLSAGL